MLFDMQKDCYRKPRCCVSKMMDMIHAYSQTILFNNTFYDITVSARILLDHLFRIQSCVLRRYLFHNASFLSVLNTLWLSVFINFSFIVHKSQFCQRGESRVPNAPARLSKTCLFPIRAVDIHLRGSDSSVIVGLEPL